ncbi:hypothetical protein [Sinomonas halotolerans]|uniref:RNA polymerase sigma-70 region 2 domain-containing protein n=1 Tax=Sinomonas halotolerans TaxID=1644133 RepID=A0ABU9WYQ6_9MICC
MSTSAHAGRADAGQSRLGQSSPDGQSRLGQSRLAGVDAPSMLRMARESASYWERRHGLARRTAAVDADDLAQEALVQVLTRLEGGGHADDLRQLINAVAANIAVRAADPVFRAEDRRARRELARKVEAFGASHLRSPSPRELEALAREVDAEWHDPRHRPSRGWEVPPRPLLSLDAPVEGADGTALGTLVPSAVPGGGEGHLRRGADGGPGGAVERFLEADEAPGAAMRAQARRLAWNGLAALEGVPEAVEGLLSQRQVTKSRAIVAACGVLAACEDWRRDLDTDARAALFAPFGPLGFADEERVVEWLDRFSEDRAFALWDSALGYANRRLSLPRNAA